MIIIEGGAFQISNQIKVKNNIEQLFEERNCKFIETFRRNGRTYYNYICNNHIDKGILTMRKDSFHTGAGCKFCGNKNTSKALLWNTSIFKTKVFELVGDEYEVIGEYTLANNPIIMLHTVCNKQYSVTPGHFIYGGRCPHCLGRNRSTEEFKSIIYELTKDEYILMSEYTKANDLVTMLHTTCQSQYDVTPSKFMSGRRCPICNQSKGEKSIYKILNDKKIKYIMQKEFDGLIGVGGGNLLYDFYLPDYNLLIEYQGQFHDGNLELQTKKELEIRQEHDRRKKEYADKHNINLLEIWYWDFENIEEILNNKLNIW